jgi:hypothetical protein
MHGRRIKPMKLMKQSRLELAKPAGATARFHASSRFVRVGTSSSSACGPWADRVHAVEDPMGWGRTHLGHMVAPALVAHRGRSRGWMWRAIDRRLIAKWQTLGRCTVAASVEVLERS